MLRQCGAGDENFKSLNAWAERHVSLLWSCAENGAAYRESFTRLYANQDIRIYDSFAGTCTASTSLRKQLLALVHKAGTLTVCISPIVSCWAHQSPGTVFLVHVTCQFSHVGDHVRCLWCLLDLGGQAWRDSALTTVIAIERDPKAQQFIKNLNKALCMRVSS